MAAIGMTTSSTHSGAMSPAAESRPAVKRRESPGRKNPISSPHSAKTMTRMPISPKVFSRFSGLRKPPTYGHGTDRSRTSLRRIAVPCVVRCPSDDGDVGHRTLRRARRGSVLTDPDVTAAYARPGDAGRGGQSRGGRPAAPHHRGGSGAAGRRPARSLGGTVTGEHGIDSIKVAWLER